MKNNNNSSRDNNGNNVNTHNNNNHQNAHHDRRKNQNQHQSHHHQAQQQFHGQNRDRSGQRNQGGQHPDSSMSRDTNLNHGNQSNLGSVRFSPGYPTRELPPIETKADPSKKFTGRCRLFIGNLPHNTTEEKLRSLFESYGEVGECFLGPKSAFAFIKMDTRQNAEAARDALDCTTYENRTLRVRLAAHAAAIRVKHLSPQVTNELLAYAFRYFGEIERAVVVVDDKGKSIGEGVVEYSKKQSALYAMKRCQQDCFMLTASPQPVLVEPFDQQDEDEGLPEKSINKNSTEFKEQRDVGPRFAEQGTFEHTFGLRWKELYEVEKQKRERLEQEIDEARRHLQDQIEYSRLEHDTLQLRSRLQQLEDNRMKLQQMKEQTLGDSHHREEHRRQQDMLIRQREEDVLRRQQLADPNGLHQQETSLRMQASALQEILTNPDHSQSNDDAADSSQTQQKSHASGSQAGADSAEAGISMNPMTSMAPQPHRTFADAAMMALNPPQTYIPVQHQLGMPPPSQNSQLNPPNMYTAFMSQPMQMTHDATGNASYIATPHIAGYAIPATTSGIQTGRQQKFNNRYNGPSNNINLTGNNNSGRPRKRGRY